MSKELSSFTGFIFRQDNQEIFRKHWNFYVKNNKLSPHYLLTNIDYGLAYSKNLDFDKSFIYIKDNKPVALVFLPIEKNGDIKTITIGGGFVLAPIFEDQKDLEKEIMEKVDSIAKEEKVVKIMFQLDPLEHDKYHYNFLMNHNYLNASLIGYLVDCQNIGMRRNHRRAIRKITKDPAFKIYIMNQANSDYNIHEQYRELHHKSAGRITRSKLTFDLLFRELEEGNATLFGLKYDNKFIAFTYFSHNYSKAISFSAADDPEFDHLPLYHIINASALNYFKKQGIKEIDMGQPLNISSQLFCYPDQKQKNISLFKTGFAGHFIEYFQGVKYFSQQIFSQDIKEFVDNYRKSI